MNIYNGVMKLYDEMKPEDNHRHRSWEHCYQFFNEPIKPKDIEAACLHLAAYLASWGMYRNSFLLQKDYKIHCGVIEIINDYYCLQDASPKDFSEKNNEKICQLIDIKCEIRKYYKESYNETATDTLITKILLGTLGCVPAYDRFFVAGIGRTDDIGPNLCIGPTLNEKNFEKLISWCNEGSNKAELNKAKNKVNGKSSVYYPIMKIVDMYFWNEGKEHIKRNTKPTKLK